MGGRSSEDIEKQRRRGQERGAAAYRKWVGLLAPQGVARVEMPRKEEIRKGSPQSPGGSERVASSRGGGGAGMVGLWWKIPAEPQSNPRDPTKRAVRRAGKPDMYCAARPRAPPQRAYARGSGERLTFIYV